MMTNMVTTSRQAATAIDVIAVKADPKCDSKPVESLPLPIRASSATDDSCCCSAPLAMRRLPAGDALIQPPVRKDNFKLEEICVRFWVGGFLVGLMLLRPFT